MDERTFKELEDGLFNYTKKNINRGKRRSLEESFERALDLIPDTGNDDGDTETKEWV